jgi:hypothetical protein
MLKSQYAKDNKVHSVNKRGDPGADPERADPGACWGTERQPGVGGFSNAT